MVQHYDVIFLHPPAIYDFRKKAIFPGPLGSTVEQTQFTKVPLGLLSLAAYLDKHGYKVIIDNLGDRMVNNPTFDVEEHIKSLSSPIFAIGLHFQQHAPGALDIARLCKKHHPHSLVMLGGLTATRFHEEIIRNYDSIDAVLRGEAEQAFLQLLQSFEREGKLSGTPNITYRTSSGEIKTSPLCEPCVDLDDFDFTRLDLLQPQTSIFAPDTLPRWSLEVCRGCIYNCAICGGSAYSYKTHLGRSKPAFRSPVKIKEDIRRLNEQGIRIIGLYQDPRMGGARYAHELLEALRDEKLDIERLSLDLLMPADEEFIQEVANIGRPITIHICPDTGSDKVRQLLGRHHSNDELLKTVKLCHKYFIPVTSFFSIGLAGETPDTVSETWELWDKLSSLEQIALTRGKEWNLGPGFPLGGPIVGPIALDPGSLAFDFPGKYGYRLLYKNLAEYIQGLSSPSWHHWLNYETQSINREALVGLILEAQAFGIEQREAYDFSNHFQSAAERQRLKADIFALNEFNRILKLKDEEKEAALLELKKRYNELL